jgi:hypothetical protein
MNRGRIGTDVKLVGGLFLIVGVLDLVIIALFPHYALKLFGTAVTGQASVLIKFHSPALHLLIGHGFLFLRPWAWGMAVAYGGFGLVSELLNQVSFGFHPLRSGFMLSTLLFLGYLIWRRGVFSDLHPHVRSASPASQEAP